MLTELVSFVCDDKDIILDFFAGSSSTAHSVLSYNSKQKQSLKFMQVQLPEPVDEKREAFKAGYKTITDIGKERIRRVIKFIEDEKLSLGNELNQKKATLTKLELEKTKNPELFKNEKSKKIVRIEKNIEELKTKISIIESTDLGFKVFKLNSSNIQAWDGNPDDLENNLFNATDNIKRDRTEEDVLYEVLLKYGLDLTLPIEEKEVGGKKVYSVGYGALFVCMANGVSTTTAQGIGEWKNELNPEVCRVVFKDSGFKSDADKTNTVQTLKRFSITEVKSI